MLVKKGSGENGIIVAVDADNLLISHAKEGQKFKDYNSMMSGFEGMFSWMQGFGKIMRADVYLPPHRCSDNPLWDELWDRYKKEFLIDFHYCPKRKSKNQWGKRDNVDIHLIEKTKEIARRYAGEFRYLCLAAGDHDYSSLLWQLKRQLSLEIAFAIGSENSFSGTYRQSGITGRHPMSGEELIHYFSLVKNV